MVESAIMLLRHAVARTTTMLCLVASVHVESSSDTRRGVAHLSSVHADGLDGAVTSELKRDELSVSRVDPEKPSTGEIANEHVGKESRLVLRITFGSLAAQLSQSHREQLTAAVRLDVLRRVEEYDGAALDEALDRVVFYQDGALVVFAEGSVSDATFNAIVTSVNAHPIEAKLASRLRLPSTGATPQKEQPPEDLIEARSQPIEIEPERRQRRQVSGTTTTLEPDTTVQPTASPSESPSLAPITAAAVSTSSPTQQGSSPASCPGFGMDAAACADIVAELGCFGVILTVCPATCGQCPAALETLSPVSATPSLSPTASPTTSMPTASPVSGAPTEVQPCFGVPDESTCAGADCSTDSAAYVENIPCLHTACVAVNRAHFIRFARSRCMERHTRTSHCHFTLM